MHDRHHAKQFILVSHGSSDCHGISPSLLVFITQVVMVERIVTYGGGTITFVCRRYPNRVNTDISQSWREFRQIISPFVAEIVVFIIPPKSLQNYPFGTLCKAKVQEHGSEQEQKQSFHLVDYFPQVNEKLKIMRYLNSTYVEKKSTELMIH
jgi:hypothetical protein